MIRFWLISGWLLLFSTAILAQTEQQNAYWTRLSTQLNSGARWEFHLEADERREWGTHEHLQFITHASVRRRISNGWSVAQGVSYSTVAGVPEYRLFQEAHFLLPFSAKWNMQHRFRIEERWFDQPNQAALRFRFRTRYRIQLNYIPWKWSVFKVSEEFFFHTDAFDQNRVYIAIEGRFSKQMALEMGYLHIYQQRSTSVLVSDVWRTTLLVRI